MGQYSLKLNAEKTQLVWLGSRHQLAKLSISQLPLVTTTSSSTVDIVSTANDLGVILDGQLTRITHISSVCRAGFFQLCRLQSIRRSLTTEATCALVQAFISCRLDYCNYSVRCHRCLSSATPVSAERGSPFGLRGSSPRPHHAGSC